VVRKRFLAAAAGVALIASVMGVAGAHQASTKASSSKRAALQKRVAGLELKSARPEIHLPASSKNMKLVGKLKLAPMDDAITDVAYFRGHAYLGAWAPLCPSEENPDGEPRGTYIVNVKKPSEPKLVGFAETDPNAYVSEGVHVFRARTDSFTGDLLLQDRETCLESEVGAGGFDIYDVSDPKNPVALAMGAGDFDSDDDGVPDLDVANDYHSVMGWLQGGKAYAVGVDNFETLDVDIFDISDPANPVLIKETGLPDWPGATSEGFFNENFHHDMWVQKVEGQWELLLSYWDVGYVRLDITDPANPVFIDDTDFASTDPQYPEFSPAEGNAHQAEWTKNGRYILAADEDFSAFRASFDITTGPNAGDYQAGEFGFTPQIETFFSDAMMNGPAVWAGRGCIASGDPAPPAPDSLGLTLDPGEEAVAVFTRGECFFSDKIAAAEAAGYSAVIIGNSHAGAAGGEAPDTPLCGSQGSEIAGTAAAVCIGHRAMHLLFGDEPNYEGPDDGSDFPPLGTVGEEISVTTEFDGWGYIHLFDAQTLEDLDTYAIPEAKDESLAAVFPLSVHEVEADPRGNHQDLFYSAYYQGGARVFRITANAKIREIGHYIRKGGADYWGVQPVPRGKKRPLLLMSDRHFGLHILKYTGKQ
jgi:hypothetical protein